MILSQSGHLLLPISNFDAVQKRLDKENGQSELENMRNMYQNSDGEKKRATKENCSSAVPDGFSN